MRPNIAISGKIGSGKTTAAQVLVEEFGYRRVGFADPIRRLADCANVPQRLLDAWELIGDLFGADPIAGRAGNATNHGNATDRRAWEAMGRWIWLCREHEDDLIRRRGGQGKARGFQQRLGMAFRELEMGVWVKALGRAVWEQGDHGQGIVCDDLRFWNEAEFFLRPGWKRVRIEAPVTVRDKRVVGGLMSDAACHVSEVELDGWREWDAVIDGAGTPEDTRRQMREIARRLTP